MQEARAVGCRTSAEADRYLEKKNEKRREAEESFHRVKDGVQGGPSGQGTPNSFMASESRHELQDQQQASSSYANDLDIMGFAETQLLSETVRMLFLISRFSSDLKLCFKQ